ncbi:conserved Plasmodium protein, unknown function [Plasmodium malariae]|uniref:Uncharacterized protein n=1 Tax=Plasmodium malariae TaxID=5858 RepID=A0A1D3JJI2_PLAMA|nr:conserved Plasmodium protein, unknown function [Plasmodium malariae]SBT86635.1 conserved Plasmodium protein, unknown function [Plasmodium malariae]
MDERKTRKKNVIVEKIKQTKEERILKKFEEAKLKWDKQSQIIKEKTKKKETLADQGDKYREKNELNTLIDYINKEEKKKVNWTENLRDGCEKIKFKETVKKIDLTSKASEWNKNLFDKVFKKGEENDEQIDGNNNEKGQLWKEYRYVKNKDLKKEEYEAVIVEKIKKNIDFVLSNFAVPLTHDLYVQGEKVQLPVEEKDDKNGLADGERKEEHIKKVNVDGSPATSSTDIIAAIGGDIGACSITVTDTSNPRNELKKEEYLKTNCECINISNCGREVISKSVTLSNYSSSIIIFRISVKKKLKVSSKLKKNEEIIKMKDAIYYDQVKNYNVFVSPNTGYIKPRGKKKINFTFIFSYFVNAFGCVTIKYLCYNKIFKKRIHLHVDSFHKACALKEVAELEEVGDGKEVDKANVEKGREQNKACSPRQVDAVNGLPHIDMSVLCKILNFLNFNYHINLNEHNITPFCAMMEKAKGAFYLKLNHFQGDLSRLLEEERYLEWGNTNEKVEVINIDNMNGNGVHDIERNTNICVDNYEKWNNIPSREITYSINRKNNLFKRNIQMLFSTKDKHNPRTDKILKTCMKNFFNYMKRKFISSFNNYYSYDYEYNFFKTHVQWMNLSTSILSSLQLNDLIHNVHAIMHNEKGHTIDIDKRVDPSSTREQCLNAFFNIRERFSFKKENLLILFASIVRGYVIDLIEVYLSVRSDRNSGKCISRGKGRDRERDSDKKDNTMKTVNKSTTILQNELNVYHTQSSHCVKEAGKVLKRKKKKHTTGAQGNEEEDGEAEEKGEEEADEDVDEEVDEDVDEDVDEEVDEEAEKEKDIGTGEVKKDKFSEYLNNLKNAFYKNFLHTYPHTIRKNYFTILTNFIYLQNKLNSSKSFYFFSYLQFINFAKHLLLKKKVQFNMCSSEESVFVQMNSRLFSYVVAYIRSLYEQSVCSTGIADDIGGIGGIGGTSSTSSINIDSNYFGNTNFRSKKINEIKQLIGKLFASICICAKNNVKNIYIFFDHPYNKMDENCDMEKYIFEKNFIQNIFNFFLFPYLRSFITHCSSLFYQLNLLNDEKKILLFCSHIFSTIKIKETESQRENIAYVGGEYIEVSNNPNEESHLPVDDNRLPVDDNRLPVDYNRLPEEGNRFSCPITFPAEEIADLVKDQMDKEIIHDSESGNNVSAFFQNFKIDDEYARAVYKRTSEVDKRSSLEGKNCKQEEVAEAAVAVQGGVERGEGNIYFISDKEMFSQLVYEQHTEWLKKNAEECMKYLEQMHKREVRTNEEGLEGVEEVVITEYHKGLVQEEEEKKKKKKKREKIMKREQKKQTQESETKQSQQDGMIERMEHSRRKEEMCANFDEEKEGVEKDKVKSKRKGEKKKKKKNYAKGEGNSDCVIARRTQKDDRHVENAQSKYYHYYHFIKLFHILNACTYVVDDEKVLMNKEIAMAMPEMEMMTKPRMETTDSIRCYNVFRKKINIKKGHVLSTSTFCLLYILNVISLDQVNNLHRNILTYPSCFLYKDYIKCNRSLLLKAFQKILNFFNFENNMNKVSFSMNIPLSPTFNFLQIEGAVLPSHHNETMQEEKQNRFDVKEKEEGTSRHNLCNVHNIVKAKDEILVQNCRNCQNCQNCQNCRNCQNCQNYQNCQNCQKWEYRLKENKMKYICIISPNIKSDILLFSNLKKIIEWIKLINMVIFLNISHVYICGDLFLLFLFFLYDTHILKARICMNRRGMFYIALERNKKIIGKGKRGAYSGSGHKNRREKRKIREDEGSENREGEGYQGNTDEIDNTYNTNNADDGSNLLLTKQYVNLQILDMQYFSDDLLLLLKVSIFNIFNLCKTYKVNIHFPYDIYINPKQSVHPNIAAPVYCTLPYKNYDSMINTAKKNFLNKYKNKIKSMHLLHVQQGGTSPYVGSYWESSGQAIREAIINTETDLRVNGTEQSRVHRDVNPENHNCKGMVAAHRVVIISLWDIGTRTLNNIFKNIKKENKILWLCGSFEKNIKKTYKSSLKVFQYFLKEYHEHVRGTENNDTNRTNTIVPINNLIILNKDIYSLYFYHVPKNLYIPFLFTDYKILVDIADRKYSKIEALSACLT